MFLLGVYIIRRREGIVGREVSYALRIAGFYNRGGEGES